MYLRPMNRNKLAAMQRARRRKRNRGISLHEVMVTVFILAIGLLGIGTLQIMSKRSNQEALQRTTASILAHDIMERIRGNPAALASYQATVGGSSVTSFTDCTTIACTPTQWAGFDLAEGE